MKKILTILILIFFTTTNVWAFPLAEYIKGREDITNSLIRTIFVSGNRALISAKTSVNTQEEAILNPVNLIGNISKKESVLINYAVAENISLIEEEIDNQGLIDEYLGQDFSIGDDFTHPIDKFEEILGDFLLGDIFIDLKNDIGDFLNSSDVIQFILPGEVFTYNMIFGEGNDLNELFAIGGIATVAGVLGEIGAADFSESSVTGQSYYGGQLVIWWPCTCGQGAMMAIDDYVTEREILLKQGTGQERIYRWYNVYIPGVYLLGSYNGNSGDVCEVQAGPYCVTIPMNGTLDSNPGTGTSAFPG